MKKLLLGLLCLPFLALGQGDEWRGRLLDADSLPLPGATVTHLRTGNKVVSNDNGYFLLKGVMLADSVKISALGYEPLWMGLRQLQYREIFLKRAAVTLDEVTVETGYYGLPKERATGSFAVVTEEKLNEQVGTRLMDRLPIIVPGLSQATQRVNSGGIFLIRGGGIPGISQESAPLIVVDNFPYEGNLDNINPNDVESVTILKDAAAASIWGAKAGNGVIVIKTKRGRFNQKTRLNLNINTSIVQEPDLQSLPVMSTSDQVDAQIFLFSNRYRWADTARSNRPVFNEVYEVLFARRRGLLSAADSAARIDELKARDVYREYQDYMYRSAINRQVSLGLSGGTQTLAWSLFTGADDNTGNLHESQRRYNVNFNNIFRPAAGVEITAALAYSQLRGQSGRSEYNSLPGSGTMFRFNRLVDEDGNPAAYYPTYRPSFIDTLGGGLLLDWRHYPLTDWQHHTVKTNSQDINLNLGLKWQLWKGLDLSVNYRWEKQLSTQDSYRSEESYYTRDRINSYSVLNRTTGTVLYQVPRGGILDRQFRQMLAQDIRGQLNFSRSWGNHSIYALAGGQAGSVDNNSSSNTMYGFYPQRSSSSAVDYRTQVVHLITGSRAQLSGGGSQSWTARRQVSFYGNARYTYLERYHLSLSTRRDASNLFGVDINDQWNPFWSAGLKWDISKESFFAVSWLSRLNLRATYGTQGIFSSTAVAAATILYSSTNNPFMGTPTASVRNIPNPELKWSTISTVNLGVDFELWKGRLSGSVEHYRKKVDALLRTVPADPTAQPGSSVVRNIGKSEANGWEISLRTKNLVGDFGWTSDVIINTFRDKLLDFREIPENKILPSIAGSNALVDGYPSYSYFAYKWVGLDPDNGDPVGYLDGATSTNYAAIRSQSKITDLVYIGRFTPLVNGSLGNNFAWRKFSVAIRFSFKLGYFFSREGVSYVNFQNQGITHSEYSERWQMPGDEASTNVPSFRYPTSTVRDAFYRSSEIMAERGDHIRFEYVQFSYHLNARFLRNTFLASTQVYANISNLGIIWRANKKGLDPDYTSFAPQRQYSIGIRFTP